ncbi:hypothetical protein CFI14_01285 [Lactiplantibacillus pentosus]|nr:hypothetical protein CFK27_04145 [Lactiplantibacillus pentosus]AYG39836.1 hypothetical protein CFI14_01285 [Lactiplantibacillus pentosus]AYJ41756.1 hypothetical protein LP314_07530 [Lactiplantibacillus pentosus]MCT3296259.1 hypothetical protein [Lactiplantibacillus pentosus]MCT3299377.1 hypothetical protein [Lactiplantibacillus pentosus]
MDFINLAGQSAIKLQSTLLDETTRFYQHHLTKHPKKTVQDKFPISDEEPHFGQRPKIHFIEDTKKTRLSEFFKIVLW